MKRKSLLLLVSSIFALSSCKFNLGNKILSFFGKNDEKQDETIESIPETSIEDFEIVDYKGGIKLKKYIGPYRPLIHIPSTLNNKTVKAIAGGCFKRSKTLKRSNVDDTGDCTAYSVPNEIDEIEENTFDSDSSFFIEGDEIKEGWEDSALNGSADGESGNIYFNINPDDLSLDEDYTVYAYLPIEDAYCLARCLTQKTEISIPSHINGKPITQIGYQSFYLNSHLERVTFPETIGYLQSYAFQECVNLKSIIFNSPNLSIVKLGAFSNCQSLDIVKMPENMAELSSRVFQNCGTLSEVYLPATLYRVLNDAFESTEVLKIIYAGSRERWEELTEKCPDIKNIPVVCLLDGETIVLDDLKSFRDVPSGAYVQITGILTGYSRQQVQGNRADYAFVTEPISRYTIICYDSELLYEPTLVGREVTAIGIKSIYFGQHEVADATLSFTDDETIYNVEPLEIDWESEYFAEGNYINYFTHYEGALTQIAQSTYIDGLDFYFFYFRNPYRGTNFSVGDVISLNFVIVPFNQLFEALPDMDSIEIISSVGE